MARKASRTDKTAEHDDMQGQRPLGRTPAPNLAKCKCGNPVCVDEWHRLARWLDNNPGNGRKLQAWVRAILDEDPEADSTFEAAQGLSLVWLGAKIEVKGKQRKVRTRTELPSARRTSKT